NEALDVAVFFQYSRLQHEAPRGRRRRGRVEPQDAQRPPRLERTPARLLAFVAAGLDGLCIVDLTEPKLPRLLESPRTRRTFRFPRGDVRSVAVNTVFDLGTQGGEVPSRERDYLYVFV